MRKMRLWTAITLVCLCAAGPAMAQFGVAQGAAALQMKPSGALAHIPSDAMAYVVINDLDAASQKVDAFIEMIGMQEQVGGPTLAILKGAGGLGEGFAPKNGMAIAVLDFKEFGIDLIEMMEGGAKNLPPIIVYAPGSSLEGIFPNVKANAVGDYKQFQMPNVPMPLMAKEMQGFVAISPLAGALEKIGKMNKPAAAALSPTQVKVLARSDLFINFNMEIVGPLYLKMFDKSIADMKRSMPDDNPIIAMMEWYKEFYGEMLSEMNDVSMSLRMAQDSVQIEEVYTYDAGGKLSIMSTPAYQASPAELLKKLPNNQYVLAMGATTGSDKAKQQGMSLINEGLAALDKYKGELPFQLPVNTTGRIRGLFETYFEQVQGMRMVVGGPANNNGVFNATFVLDVKEPAAVRQMLSKKAQLLEDVIHAAGKEEEPEVLDLDISLLEGVTTLQGTDIDAFKIDHPQLAQMPDQVRTMMQMILGEQEIRFLMAEKGNDTMVFSFGSGSDGMTAALQALDGAGLNQAPGVDKALTDLPEKVSAVMLFSPANLYSVVKSGVGKVNPWEEMPFEFNAIDPLSIGISSNQTEGHMVFRVPHSVIKETFRIINEMQAQQRRHYEERRGGRNRGDSGEDF